jgi:hypothetical protein
MTSECWVCQLLIPCHETAEWAITTKYTGLGGPTRTRYCDEHFLNRLR